MAYRLSPPENFVYFWSLVFPLRLPGVIRRAGQNTGRKSRFKNTSTKNFEVFTWILACICTRMLWIIWLNAHSHYLTVFVLSYFGCRQFWENGQFRPRTQCQNEPKICQRHRRTLKFHILGGFSVLMHLGKFRVISFTSYRLMIKCVPYSGVWPQSGVVLASRYPFLYQEAEEIQSGDWRSATRRFRLWVRWIYLVQILYAVQSYEGSLHCPCERFSVQQPENTNTDGKLALLTRVPPHPTFGT